MYELWDLAEIPWKPLQFSTFSTVNLFISLRRQQWYGASSIDLQASIIFKPSPFASNVQYITLS